MENVDSPECSVGALNLSEPQSCPRPTIHRANSSQQRSIPIHSDSGQVKCNCSRLVLHDHNDRFEKVFAERMKDHNHKQGYKSVAVLLLTWEGNDLDGLKEEARCFQTSRELL